MSSLFVVLGGAALTGFAVGVCAAGVWRVWRRLRTRHLRFRLLP